MDRLLNHTLSRALKLKRGDSIALCGAGGKSSVLYTLARENPFSQALFTTSTKMYDPRNGPHPFHRILLEPEKLPRPLGKVECCFTARSLIPGHPAKVQGLSNKIIELWNYEESWPMLVIEADGAASCSIKLPRSHEPLIPGNVTIVLGCIGLDVLGKSLESGFVHHPEEFRERMEMGNGDVISIKILLEVIRRKDGLFKNAPDGVRKTVLLNKMDRLSPEYKLHELIDELRENLPEMEILATQLNREQIQILK